MKFAHIADLHFGITVNQISMIDEQKEIIEQIISIMKDDGVNVLLISGDVYDKGTPSVEAVRLLETFLERLEQEQITVYMIAGNHDNGTRLTYGKDLFARHHIYMDGEYDGKIAKYIHKDEYGPVHIYLLPFIRPAYVNRYIEKEEDKVKDYTQAVMKAVETGEVDYSERNILLSHQFVIGAEYDPMGSEELIVGGTDGVSKQAYAGFDYVALGHIHNYQQISNEPIYYSGTPLKYSFSEENKEKYVLIADLQEKGNLTITKRVLQPIHDIRTIRGKYQEIVERAAYDEAHLDYVRFILEDEQDIPDAIRNLRTIYPNAMRLDYDNTRTRQIDSLTGVKSQELSPYELFKEFYEKRNHTNLTEEQMKILQECIAEIWEGE